MINLSTEESFALDYLSILEIKKDRYNKIEEFNRCLDQLRWEIGPELFDIIISSQEYFNLKNANIKTFDAVDRARYGSINDITAKEVDDCNFDRHKAKSALQEKFFKTQLKEFKN